MFRKGGGESIWENGKEYTATSGEDKNGFNYMTATARYNNGINFQFKHKMSRIGFHMKDTETEKDFSIVSLEVTEKNSNKEILNLGEDDFSTSKGDFFYYYVKPERQYHVVAKWRNASGNEKNIEFDIDKEGKMVQKNHTYSVNLMGDFYKGDVTVEIKDNSTSALKVKKHGETKWTNSIKVKVGESYEIQINTFGLKTKVEKEGGGIVNPITFDRTDDPKDQIKKMSMTALPSEAGKTIVYGAKMEDKMEPNDFKIVTCIFDTKYARDPHPGAGRVKKTGYTKLYCRIRNPHEVDVTNISFSAKIKYDINSRFPGGEVPEPLRECTRERSIRAIKKNNGYYESGDGFYAKMKYESHGYNDWMHGSATATATLEGCIDIGGIKTCFTGEKAHEYKVITYKNVVYQLNFDSFDGDDGDLDFDY